jgi:hypothetical protein
VKNHDFANYDSSESGQAPTHWPVSIDNYRSISSRVALAVGQVLCEVFSAANHRTSEQSHQEFTLGYAAIYIQPLALFWL